MTGDRGDGFGRDAISPERGSARRIGVSSAAAAAAKPDIYFPRVPRTEWGMRIDFLAASILLTACSHVNVTDRSNGEHLVTGTASSGGYTGSREEVRARAAHAEARGGAPVATRSAAPAAPRT
jgi:hypothetical protein